MSSRKLNLNINPLVFLLAGLFLCGKNSVYKSKDIAYRLVQSALHSQSLEAMYKLTGYLSSDRMLSKLHNVTADNIKDIIHKYNKKRAIIVPKRDIEEIFAYLNMRTGRSYRSDTTVNVKLVKRWFKEGYGVEDFKRVIDNKILDPWFRENPKYLRPTTLFGNKFADYHEENSSPLQTLPPDDERKSYEDIMRERQNRE